MPFVTMTKPTVGATTKKSLIDLIIDNIDFLNASGGLGGGGNLVLNGSFENGTGADTAPSNWDLTITSGNSTAFETSAANTRHGQQAFSMTNPGAISGGVELISTDFIDVAEDVIYQLSWFMKATIATTSVQVAIKYYDEAESIVSTDTVYNDSTTVPTSWIRKSYSSQAPAGAKLAKVSVVGVNNTTAASCYFDGMEMFFDPEGHGVKKFTSSTTWTVPVNARKVHARIWAAGGGGAGGDGGSNAGGGGGSGAYCEATFEFTAGQSVGVTIGAGGSGGAVSANGTAGGSSVFNGVTINGGFGGTATGTLGGGGAAGTDSATTMHIAGNGADNIRGGDSPMGAGIGALKASVTGATVIAAKGYGAGGAGGAISTAGSNGAPGLIVVRW